MYKQVNNENEIEKHKDLESEVLIEGKKLQFRINLYRENQKFSLELINFSKKQDPVNADWALDWSSQEEHRADALALGAEEGRDKLR